MHNPALFQPLIMAIAILTLALTDTVIVTAIQQTPSVLAVATLVEVILAGAVVIVAVVRAEEMERE